MSADFHGTWVDNHGRMMTIRSVAENQYIVSLFSSSGQPFVRDMLEGKRPSTDMPASVSEGRLVVELGTVGLGPTLKLAEENTLLVLEVETGIYDDWEDDFGVPWVFPLSSYTKADTVAAF